MNTGTRQGTRVGPGQREQGGGSGINVCFVCQEYPPGGHGGIGTFTQIMSQGLVTAGHGVRVIGVYPVKSSGASEEQGEVRVLRLPATNMHLGWMWDRFRLYRSVRRWSRQGEIDIIEVPDWEGWAAGWPRLPVPVVTRLHGSVTYFTAEAGKQSQRVPFWLEKASLNRSDYVVSVSRYTAERTRQQLRMERPVDAVLYNPVDVDDKAPARARSGSQVVFTGTLTAKKGVESLIRAWLIVCQRDPTAELHLYGRDGYTERGQSMRGHLESLLSDSARPRIHFHGQQPRAIVLRALRDARAAVFPSLAEAFAIAPLEAMACGCPTIYTRRCSGPELLEHGVHGLLVDPDQPEEIAAYLLQLLQEPDWASQLAEAGRRHVGHAFGLASQLVANTRFYQSCIESFHRR